MTEPLSLPQEANEYGVTSDFISTLISALETGEAQGLLEPLHPADLAHIFVQLTDEQRQWLITALGERFTPHILKEIEHPDIKESCIRHFGTSHCAEALSTLDIDDAIHIIEDLDSELKEALLTAMPAERRTILQEGLAYPDDSAGRLLEKQLIAIPEYWTIGSLIEFLRSNESLPDDFYDIFVVDPKFRPVGTLKISHVLRAKQTDYVRDVMRTDMTIINPAMDQEEVAHLFRQYGLVSAPVVGEDNRLVGVISVDDVVHVIDEEAQEDILRMGGLSESDIHSPPLPTATRRLPWLIISLIAAILVSMVIGLFEETLKQYVALAVLMPIIAAITANAATQTATVAIRAIATKELTAVNAKRVILKEIMVGLLIGLGLAFFSAIMVIIRYNNIELSIIFASAVIFTMIIATFSGAAIPLLLSKFRIDPAIASSALVTTVTDMLSFGSFLGLATWWLLKL